MSGTPNKFITVTKDGILVNPTADTGESGGTLRNPATGTPLDPWEFTDSDLLYAATHEPVAGFLIYGIPADVVEKWFRVNVQKTEGEDPEFDAAIQKPLIALKWKQILKQTLEYERLYGKALVVGSFSDAAKPEDLQKERRQGAEPLQFVAYPKTEYAIDQLEKNPVSLRFGLPVTYRINSLAGNRTVHWTRCHELQTRTNAQSILALIWFDLTCGSNIRWGVSQWIFRTGGGFVVITFPKEVALADGTVVKVTPEMLAAWQAQKEWNDITHKNYICIIEGMKFEFAGAGGVTLDPTPFFDTNMKQFSIATRIPKSMFEGSEAGAVLGSAKDEGQYYKAISGIQSSLDELNRWGIDACIEGGLVTGAKNFVDARHEPAGSVLRRMLHKVHIIKDASDQMENVEYTIEWNSAFELNALDEARTENIQEDTNIKRLEYQTLDEVRVKNKLKELPNSEGAKLKTASVDLFGGQGKPLNQDPNAPATDEHFIVTPVRRKKRESPPASA
jgi:hypothetical protein